MSPLFSFYNLSSIMLYEGGFLLDKKEAIDLLSKKLNDDHNLSYDKLAIITGHSKRQLIRPLKEKGIDSTLNTVIKVWQPTIVHPTMKLITLSILKNHTLISL